MIDGFIDPEATALVIAALDATEPPDPTDGPAAPRSLAQRRADALVTICAAAVGATAPTTRARARVDIVLDADTALGRAPTDLLHARCEIRGGGALSKAAIERILCDSPVGYALVRRAVARAMTRAPSEVLDLGRRRRDPSSAQRRAVLLRDECCQYPGAARRCRGATSITSIRGSTEVRPTCGTSSQCADATMWPCTKAVGDSPGRLTARSCSRADPG